MAKFLLRFGSAAHPVRPDAAPSEIKRYAYNPGQDYPVELWGGVHSGEEVGSCRVSGSEGAFMVEPSFVLGFDPSDCTWRATWDVDDEGVANLSSVMLVVGGLEGPRR